MEFRKMAFLKSIKLFVGISIALELSSLHRAVSVIGNPSECTKHESYIISRYTSYIETYRIRKWGIFRKTATRVNWRWDYHTALKVVKECCHGYKKEKAPSGCDPVCPSGCKNGVCFQPNVCKCFPGFIASLNTKNQYIECIPSCPDGCNGGICTAPGICTCNHGFQLARDRKTCTPMCFNASTSGIQGCGVDATCIAPDTCQCHDGYEKNPKSPPPLCLPKCIPSCGSNSFCNAPNNCLCNTGYIEKQNRSSPVSQIQNENIECIPNCPDGCNGGMCTAPGICTCNDGFQSTDRNSCVPVCFTAGTSGTEGCGDHATCIAPVTCQCHEGYERNPNGPPPHCVPKCFPPCGPNAICEAPDKCVCTAGYVIETDAFSTSTSPVSNPMTTVWLFTAATTLSNVATINCKPLCVPGCEKNSTCVSPNKCQCNPRYRSASSVIGPTTHLLQCLPICEHACVNAFCASPNKCVCNFGYKPHPVDSFVCIPICHNECVYASCTLPDHCECYDGYVKELNNSEYHVDITTNKCIPSCPGGCLNGKCVAPGQCACNPGYILAVYDTTSEVSTSIGFSNINRDIPTDYSTNDYTTYSTDDNTTDNASFSSSDDTSYSTRYSTSDIANYSSSGHTSYSTTDRSDYSSNDSINYSSAVAPILQPICQPLCEPDCPIGLICIEPNQCQLKSNGTDNGSTSHTIEWMQINHTTGIIIGTITLLAIILGLGLGIFLIHRRRKKVVTQGLMKGTVSMMDHSEASYPLFSADESSIL